MLCASTTVELGNTIIIVGSATRPGTTVAVQEMEWLRPAVELPENEILTLGAGRSERTEEQKYYESHTYKV